MVEEDAAQIGPGEGDGFSGRQLGTELGKEVEQSGEEEARIAQAKLYRTAREAYEVIRGEARAAGSPAEQATVERKRRAYVSELGANLKSRWPETFSGSETADLPPELSDYAVGEQFLQYHMPAEIPDGRAEISDFLGQHPDYENGEGGPMTVDMVVQLQAERDDQAAFVRAWEARVEAMMKGEFNQATIAQALDQLDAAIPQSDKVLRQQFDQQRMQIGRMLGDDDTTFGELKQAVAGLIELAVQGRRSRSEHISTLLKPLETAGILPKPQ